jgi:hypothetical protein
MVPARERQLRRVAAVGVLLALVITFALVFRRVLRAFTPVAQPGALPHARWGFRKYAWAYVLMLPAVLTVLGVAISSAGAGRGHGLF